MAQYRIVSIDNGQVGLGGGRLERGEYDSAEMALARARQLVDQALHQLDASSAHELMARYMRMGSEVPVIYGEPRVVFHAYRYAREKANAMFPAPSDG